MKVVQHLEPESFWRAAGPVYESDPLRHTVALTVMAGLRASPPSAASAPPLLVTVQDGADTIGAAFCTPPFPMAASAVPEHAATTLVRWLLDNGVTLTGAAAPERRAAVFADAWRAASGDRAEPVLSMRLFRLCELRAPGTAGSARIAAERDVPLLVRWRAAFDVDTGHPRPGLDFADSVRRSIAAGSCHLLWEVGGEPVAHALASAPLNGMSRIGPVFTPAEHRRHGYGSAATAAVARWALHAGAEHVLLFADTANPVANSIYQRIGFRPVYDAVEYRFTPATPG